MSNAVVKAPRRPGNVMIENGRILFRNFSGKPDAFNVQGNKKFTVVIDPDMAEMLIRDGWNVRYLKAREEGEEPTPILEVTLSWKHRPPQVTVITSRGRTDLDEPQVMVLDWAEFKNVDMIINPYRWVVGEKTGIKAYLKSIYITILEDPLELKYADVKEIEGTNLLQIEAGAGRLPSDPDEIVIEEEDMY